METTISFFPLAADPCPCSGLPKVGRVCAGNGVAAKVDVAVGLGVRDGLRVGVKVAVGEGV